jgi:hypothetical protein
MQHFRLSTQENLQNDLKYITHPSMAAGWILPRLNYLHSDFNVSQITEYPICLRSEHYLGRGLWLEIHYRKALIGCSLLMLQESSSFIFILLLRFRVYKVLFIYRISCSIVNIQIQIIVYFFNII